MKEQKHLMEAGKRKSLPKPGEETNATITVVNHYKYPIVATATNAFWGLLSSGFIMPGESLVMPIGASAAADVYCFHGNHTGLLWEGTYPVFTMHYTEVQWTVWAGQTATFGKATMEAGK